MNNNQLDIIIKAQDMASAQLKDVNTQIKNLEGGAGGASSAFATLKDNSFALFTAAAGAAIGVKQLFNAMADSVKESFKLQSSLAGLSSVSKAFNQDVNLANKAAQELASDGLITVTESALGLKNLMSSGFSLPESISLFKSLKDQSVYNRQSFYGLGEAVVATTEGIKNGNSVLADATGTTKNLSVMAKEAGISVDRMGSISQDAGYRLAVYKGFTNDAARSTGDAAKYLDTAAGKAAQLGAQTTILQQKIGNALQPALLSLLEVITPIITKVAGWIEKNPELTATIAIVTTATLGLIAVVGTIGLAIAGLGPIFTAFGAVSTLAMSGVSLAFGGLSALVALPLIMPAIAVGAAIIAIGEVINAYNTMQSAIKGAEDAAKSAESTKIVAVNTLLKDVQAGVGPVSAEAKAKAERSKKALHGLGVPGYASGGFTGQGGDGEFAGIVHKGEYVVPKSQVNQSTGKPKMGGMTIINNNTFTRDSDPLAFARTLGFQLARSL